MDTTPAELLEHAANLYAQGRFSMTLDPLQFAWRDMHPDAPLVESTYMRASEAISATAGVEHEPGLWFTVFSRRNADQVAALLKQSVALAGLPEISNNGPMCDEPNGSMSLNGAMKEHPGGRVGELLELLGENNSENNSDVIEGEIE